MNWNLHTAPLAGTALLSVSGIPAARGITIDTASHTPRIIDSWGDHGELRHGILGTAALFESGIHSHVNATRLVWPDVDLLKSPLSRQ